MRLQEFQWKNFYTKQRLKFFIRFSCVVLISETIYYLSGFGITMDIRCIFLKIQFQHCRGTTIARWLSWACVRACGTLMVKWSGVGDLFPLQLAKLQWQWFPRLHQQMELASLASPVSINSWIYCWINGHGVCLAKTLSTC